MAETRIDVTDFIDERPFSWFQGRVLALCILIQITDGIDLQAIGYAGPGIREDLHLSLPQMGPVFSAGLFGMMCGALVFGPIADKIGRRAVMLISAALFGVFSLAIAFVSTREELIALRFLAGLGFGGALPNSLGYFAEYLPRRGRYTIMGLSGLGFIGGSAISGWIALALLPHFGWRSIFVAGGAAALVMGAVALIWLPESLRFLAARGGREMRVASILKAIDPRFGFPSGARFVVRDEAQRGLPVRHLFTAGRGVMTLPFWFAAFFVLLDLYLLVNWIPILTRQQGLPVEQGIFIASLFQVGAAFAGVTAGLLMDRFSPFRVLACYAALGAVAVVGLAFAGANPGLLMAGTFIAGFFIVGCQGCLNMSTATMYPTYARITGAGWMLGIGRIGSIIGPLVGGTLLAFHWPAVSLFYFAALPLLLVLCAALFLASKASHFVLPRQVPARPAMGSRPAAGRAN